MAKKKIKKRVLAPNKAKTEHSNIAVSPVSSGKPVLMTVCRLCEMKDGPFLDIFDAERVTTKKIQELMPFVIEEKDDLPHKICFRCSAKVEELYEFIQKCVRTQNNLQSTIGKKSPLLTKDQTIVQWKEKLNELNLCQDDISTALIKKTIENIKNISLNSKAINEKLEDNNLLIKSKSEDTNITLDMKQANLAIETCDSKLPTRNLRSNNIDTMVAKTVEKKETITQNESKSQNSESLNKKEGVANNEVKLQEQNGNSNFADTNKKPFNIMDHVSKIKVNGVGILFQCQLCDKNFLKLDIVATHGCAKNGAPTKLDFTKYIPPPLVPKAPTVKYIKIDGNNKKVKELPTNSQKPIEPQASEKQQTKIPEPPNPPPKPKPKIGPASKVKRPISPKNDIDKIKLNSPPVQQTAQDVPAPVTPQLTTVGISNIPKLNTRYSLMPGPNNTFTLVQEPISNPSISRDSPKKTVVKNSDRPRPKSKKIPKVTTSPEVIDLVDTELPPLQPPYPVGLFKTVTGTTISVPSVAAAPPTFTTPAMKKQSYTVVQTGNPSKLLISTKRPQPSEQSQNKRQKKLHNTENEQIDQPFKVTIEDKAPPAKDAAFFTFINVDPLLQPSYVLPTDNVQESQISTSTENLTAKTEKKDADLNYLCNMCDSHFTREKKLLSHIQSHYKQMDDEDEMRDRTKSKKKKVKT